ncbi:MAG: hypothetical protein OFPI_44990 [Osedax symbiont Rs2]|nr:MAG: hypothetical protein OFPI_44990 [Osedax symbiont Rs2]
MTVNNYPMLVAGLLSALAALLHLAIIVGGATWYRFFGAGEQMAQMAETGSVYPVVVTFAIAVVLASWALYGFSAAGLGPALPFMKFALVAISLIYLFRAIGGVVVHFMLARPGDFLLYSSLICLLYASAYILGTVQLWSKL